MNQSPLQSLVDAGTKLWLDSIDPDLIARDLKLGATGATSNPIIVSQLIGTGRFDGRLKELAEDVQDPAKLSWLMTDDLVTAAEAQFRPIWEKTKGDDGYVSFELDPLLEDTECRLSVEEKAERYRALGEKWAQNHPNRLIKIPATPGGLAALEDLVAAGVNPNITLIFSERQYLAARDAVWRGAQKRSDLTRFKSVYSIFVSRLDIYSEKHVPDLITAAQGMVGILNAKRIWRLNTGFWQDKGTPLKQEMIFASTGTKKASDPKWKYVAALCGSDIETNPPETNDAVHVSGMVFEPRVAVLPDDNIIKDIDAKVDWRHLEETLMREGLAKFADPQKMLIKSIADKLANWRML